MNEYNSWNQIKIQLSEGVVIDKFPKEREVWMCFVGKNIGQEQNGVGEQFLRPVMVIKKFNNKIFWVIPLTSKQKKLDFYYNFTDPTGKQVAAVIAQFKLLSIQRFSRRMYEINNNEFISLKETIKSFL